MSSSGPHISGFGAVLDRVCKKVHIAGEFLKPFHADSRCLAFFAAASAIDRLVVVIIRIHVALVRVVFIVRVRHHFPHTREQFEDVAAGRLVFGRRIVDFRHVDDFFRIVIRGGAGSVIIAKEGSFKIESFITILLFFDWPGVGLS